MDIFGFSIEITPWRIFVLIMCVLYVAWYFLKPVKEGFQSAGQQIEQMTTCPAIRNTIKLNKELLEGYLDKNAVVSAEHTQEMLDHFTAAYEKHDCEEFLKTLPADKPADKPIEPEEATDES